MLHYLSTMQNSKYRAQGPLFYGVIFWGLSAVQDTLVHWYYSLSGETKMDFGGVSFCNQVSTNYYIDFTDNVWLTF